MRVREESAAGRDRRGNQVFVAKEKEDVKPFSRSWYGCPAM